MSSNKSICVGFILYNPTESVANRIDMLQRAGIKCYIFDNTPQISFVRERFRNSEEVAYLTGGKNTGLGIGLTIINGQAYYDGFKATLFFDQDTVFSLDTVYFVENFYKQNLHLLDNYSSVLFNAKNITSCKEAFCIRDVLLSISSGSLFILKAVNKIGYHNTSFFVDCVDYEFCLNSDNHGYKTMECSNTPGFDHVTEQDDRPYLFLGKTLMLRKYSWIRVKGTLSSSIRLFFMALSRSNFKYAYAILRSGLIYINFQILVRILNLVK